MKEVKYKIENCYQCPWFFATHCTKAKPPQGKFFNPSVFPDWCPLPDVEDTAEAEPIDLIDKYDDKILDNYNLSKIPLADIDKE